MIAKALSLAWVSFQVTDLEKLRQFMTDFGLFPVDYPQSDDLLLLRGSGSTPVIHISQKANENRFSGIALNVSREADLQALASQPKASSIETNPFPGGGLRVRLPTPDGIEITALFGVQAADPLPLRDTHLFNDSVKKPRVNASIRARAAISPVIALGHCVLRVSQCDDSVQFFEDMFGMVVSDYISTPALKPIGAFMRFDHGEKLVEHHSLLINESKNKHIGLHHCGFEVQDLDSVYVAHEYLMQKGYSLECGVGRHLLGSQIYDYWQDPFGNRVEHYTDGDMVNQHHETTHFTGRGDETTQWGMKVPPSFFS